jgi:hypothetical protein
MLLHLLGVGRGLVLENTMTQGGAKSTVIELEHMVGRRAETGLEGDFQYDGHGHREHFGDGGDDLGRQVVGVAFTHLEI